MKVVDVLCKGLDATGGLFVDLIVFSVLFIASVFLGYYVLTCLAIWALSRLDSRRP